MTKTRDGGFTLIELLVITAILVLMTGGVTIGISLLGRGDVKKAVKAITSTMAETRTNALSISGDWSFRIYRNEKGTYAQVRKRTEDSQTEIFSSSSLGSKIHIFYQDSKLGERELEEGDAISFLFQPESGEIRAVYFQKQDEANEWEGGSSLKGSDSYSGRILIKTGSSSRENKISVSYRTGKAEADTD